MVTQRTVASLFASYEPAALCPANRVKNRWNIKSRPFSKEAGKRAAAVVAQADLSGNADRNEGAYQKKSGEWISRYFPGREFDDLDELRAAKKRRK